MGLVHNGTGTQWDWCTIGLVHNGTGAQRDWYTMELVHSGTGALRHCPVAVVSRPLPCLFSSSCKNFEVWLFAGVAQGGVLGMAGSCWSLSAVFNKTQHVSFLQGVFLLRPSDTLSVLADLGHINTRQRKRTFFGAFRI